MKHLLLLHFLLTCSGCGFLLADRRDASGTWTGRVVPHLLVDEQGKPVVCLAFERVSGDRVSKWVKKQGAPVLVDNSCHAVGTQTVAIGDTIRVTGDMGIAEITSNDGRTKLCTEPEKSKPGRPSPYVFALRSQGQLLVLHHSSGAQR
ncbi:MAG TPA: hypothetical protein VIL86_06560 [Tepidisphaeraceae bacterium]|jgi:hypothetical protein